MYSLYIIEKGVITVGKANETFAGIFERVEDERGEIVDHKMGSSKVCKRLNHRKGGYAILYGLFTVRYRCVIRIG
jgi:DNA/RNA-binding domain of Phe-tRNA-synthetase-like protein